MIRNQLHLTPGAKLSCVVDGDSVILTPERPRSIAPEYTIDPRTGLQVRKAQDGVEPITSEMVRKMLEDFP